MFQFYWPWFAILLPLPLFIKFLLPLSKHKADAAPLIHYFSLHRIKRAFSGRDLSHNKNLFFKTLFGLFWVCLILALMQPEWTSTFRQEKNKGYDLMLAVDISASMLAVDFSEKGQAISRLDAVKDVVGKFVLGRQGDRVGLITFGESAYLHVPLTLDTVSVSRMLNDALPGMAGNATAIGDAIGLGVKTLRQRPEGSRVLVLLTDGVDNSSSIPPLEAAKLAKQYGVRIYTIGVGKNGPVPYPTGRGGYTMVEVAMDEELLKEIADLTDGQFFLASDRSTLREIYNKINRLEKSESNEASFLIRDPLYQYPLSIALACFLLLAFHQIYAHRRV